MDAFADTLAARLDRAPAALKEGLREREVNRRLLWFLLLRAAVAASLTGVALSKGLLFPELQVPAGGLLVCALILLGADGLFWLHYRSSTDSGPEDFVRGAERNLQAQIVLDFLVLAYLVFECGGIESPLAYFFLFHNALSCLFFRRRVSLAHTLLSIAILVALEALRRAGAVPERHFIALEAWPTPSVPFRVSAYYLAGLSFFYLAAWYLVSTITERLRLREHQLEEKVEELLEVDRTKTRYMLVTTHELKAPFAAIQSYAEVLLDGYAGELSPKAREILERVQVRCQKLLGMLKDMIRLSNITTTKERRGALATGLIDLGLVGREAVEPFRESAARKGIAFDFERLEGGRHLIEGNLEQIQILLSNIVGNAVSYSDPGTVVRLWAEHAAGAEELCVSNRGIVVRPEHAEKVFLEYFRSEEAVKANPNGTGLGLAIARQIMGVHRGRIAMETDAKGETVVRMRFPRTFR